VSGFIFATNYCSQIHCCWAHAKDHFAIATIIVKYILAIATYKAYDREDDNEEWKTGNALEKHDIL